MVGSISPLTNENILLKIRACVYLSNLFTVSKLVPLSEKKKNQSFVALNHQEETA